MIIRAMVIYGLLAKLLMEKKMFEDAWFEEITSEYHLPSIDRLSEYQLFDIDGKTCSTAFLF